MKVMTRGLLSAMLAGTLALSSASAFAQEKATGIGVFNDWTAWQGKDDNGTICYISGAPAKTEPGNVNRDPIHFLVIHRKGLGIRNEVQTLIGYPFNANANASATVDGKAFPMVTEGAAAWLASADAESGFVEALKKGVTLVVKGTSQRGTNTVDTYSLRGVTAAMGAIDKACT